MRFVSPEQGFRLDLDSTVFQRSGEQQGAAKGYNPRWPGRKSHHPLLAVLAEAPCLLHGWLRSGNTGAAKSVCEFLKEALALLPSGWKLRCVRADSGFFAEELLEFLEERSLGSVGEFQAQLFGWKKPRRFVVVRERFREEKSAVGRKRLEVPGYTFRIFVTSRSEDALVLWRDYNRRATIEQRIEELKAELAADGFYMQNFFATESAFLAVLFTFNLLSLY